MPEELPEDFLKLVSGVTAKRPRTVIEHILKHGFVTTEELQNLYGYEHPPRAARDVRELGIPLETFHTTNSQGRRIAAYKFGDPSKSRRGLLSGRKIMSKDFKNSLVQEQGEKCGICLTPLEARYLQVDHRIPFEVAGEGLGGRNLRDYMLICGSCNRAKSWSCEHCENWRETQDVEVCKTCYWCSPENYTHIASTQDRRIVLVWSGDESKDYDALLDAAVKCNESLPEFIKRIVQNACED